MAMYIATKFVVPGSLGITRENSWQAKITLNNGQRGPIHTEFDPENDPHAGLMKKQPGRGSHSQHRCKGRSDRRYRN